MKLLLKNYVQEWQNWDMMLLAIIERDIMSVEKILIMKFLILIRELKLKMFSMNTLKVLLLNLKQWVFV